MRILVALLSLLLLGTATPAHADEGLLLVPPVPGAVVSPFRPGPQAWSAGHRGVDLAGGPGDAVLAAADGVVHFAGRVAGVPSVSIDHGGGLRTTYTPVSPMVAAGEAVRVGQVVGRLQAGHCTDTCLHWGLTDGETYFDPTAHLLVQKVELLPLGTVPRAAAPLLVGVSSFGLPVAGRITSRFGPRLHPILGVRKLHDGADIAARCGEPVRAPIAGTVVAVESHRAYGNRVFVQHDGGVRTAYAHLSSIAVTPGMRIPVGTTIGGVGSTGLSTGCHLHWMAWRDGRLLDPLSL